MVVLINIIEIRTSIHSSIFDMPRRRIENWGADGSSNFNWIVHAYTINRCVYDSLTGLENDEIHHQPCSLTYAFCWQTFLPALTD